MPILSGAQITMEVLVKEGVEHIFGYPGGAIMPIYDAMLDYNIHHVLTRHEQGAAHAADGYARASGKVGVAMATSGPGATNLVTGIATAMLDSSPIVCITGQVPSQVIGTDAFQETDVTGVTLPITKHNYLVTEIEELADTLREAFYIARSGRQGTVLVEIAKDVQSADPLNFIATKKYTDQIRDAQEKTGSIDAVKTLMGRINGIQTILAIMDFSFIGGSMGSVVGEKISRAIDRAIKNRLPLVIITASGGARMQEGAYSLMQMAKICSKLAYYSALKKGYDIDKPRNLAKSVTVE